MKNMLTLRLFFCFSAFALAATPAAAQTFRPITETAVCGAGTNPAAPGNPARYSPGVPVGTDFRKVELRSPDAICNDGSPAVMYVRRATPGARDQQGPVENKWLIELKGGGTCGDFYSCIERWCGLGSYDPSYMSTRWAPNAIGGTGIQLRSSINHFGDWNHVYVYYCSSDSWGGRKRNSTLTDPDDPSRGYILHFMGSRIVDAVFDLLLQGVTDTSGAPLLPNLNAATDVVFAGWSAGGGGIRNNADRIGTRLKAANPNLNFKAVVDAGVVPDEAGLSGLPPGSPSDPYTQLFSQIYRDEVFGLKDALLDESCVQFHRASGTEFLCADSQHVSRHHITTPFFQRQDYKDPLALERAANGGNFATVAAAAQAMWDNMDKVKNLLTTAEEARNMTIAPGAIGNLCADHVSMQNNNDFHAVRVRTPATGQSYSFHQLLSNWFFGRQPVAELGARPSSAPPNPPNDPLCSVQLQAVPAFTSVNSASFATEAPVAPNSIVAGFGNGLAASTVVATSVPLPAELGGTRVNVTDGSGTTRPAPLFFVSPNQVNYLMPAGMALGAATVSVIPSGGSPINGPAQIVAVAPALYAANAQGQGVAAGLFLRVASDGTRTEGLLFDPNTLASVPVDLGATGDQVFLMLFGTGMCGAAATGTAGIGGIGVPVQGPVPQGQFVGLCQVNLGPLPRRLVGRGEMTIGMRVDGFPTNEVTVNIR